MNKRFEHSSSRHLNVSASELAQMGVCEQLVQFEHLHGARRTWRQRQRKHRGLVEHQRFFRETLAIRTRTSHVDTLFDEARAAMAALQRFLRRVLLRWAASRAFMAAVYCKGSLWLNARLAVGPAWAKFARACFRIAGRVASRLRSRREGPGND